MVIQKILKLIAYLGVVFIALFIVANYNYFQKNIEYAVNEPEPVNHAQYEPNTLYIPVLGVSAPIVLADTETEEAFQKAAGRGVGHYPGTAKIGEYGNVFLFGHSSDYPWAEGDYKTVFALLPRIEIGANVYATDERGNIYKYRVFDKFVADKSDTHLLGQYDYERKLMTLQTSWPIGTALMRYIVLAELKED